MKTLFFCLKINALLALLCLPANFHAQTTPTPIAYGQSILDTISPASEVDLFTLVTSPGDMLYLRVSPVSSFVNPKIEVWTPQGTLFASAFTGDNDMVQLLKTIPPNGGGTYTILVSDNLADDTGRFCLTAERFNSPPAASLLNCNSSLNSAVECASSLKSFRFMTQQNALSRIVVTPVSSFVGARVWICAANGTVLAQDSAGTYEAVTLDVSASQTDCYYVLVGDTEGDDTGGFAISHALLFGACASAAIQSTPANGSVCLGASFSLSAATPFPGATYSWSGPNGFSSSQASISFSDADPAMSGAYMVTVTSGGVCSSTASRTITVQPLPNVSIASTPASGVLCSGQNFSLNTTTNAANPSFAWSGPDGFGSNSQNVAINSASVQKSGIYSVTVTNGVTGCTQIQSASILVHQTPSAAVLSVPASGAVCNGQPLLLDVSTNASNPIFSWSGPAGFSSTLKNPLLPAAGPPNAGIYTVTVTDGLNGCANTSTKTISINPLPTISVVPIPAGGVVCQGQSLTLNAITNAVNPGFVWSGPAGFSSAQQGVSITGVETVHAGVYSVTATSGATGCANSGSATITVNPLPAVVIDATPDGAAVCTGGSVTLCAVSDAANPGFQWTGPLGFAAPVPCVALNNAFPVSSGNYQLVVTDGLTGCSNTAVQAVTVSALPTLDIAATPDNGIVCPGGEFVFCALTDAELPVFQWSGPNGFSASNSCVSDDFVTAANAGTYFVTLTDAATGCSNTSNIAFVVQNITANITTTLPGDMACLGQSFILCALTSAAEPDYAWSGPNGFGAATACPVVGNATVGGVFSVTVTEPATGCTALAELNIPVNNPPPLAINATPADGIVCAGSTFQLCAETTVQSPLFQWNNFVTEACIAPLASLTSTYSVILTDAATGCSTSASILITVIPLPEADFSVLQSGDTVIFLNHSQHANAYLWNFGDGAISVEEHPVHVYATPGPHTVTLSASNSCGADLAIFSVLDAGDPVWMEKFKLFPNPNQGVFSVEIQGVGGQNIDFELFDLHGRSVGKKRFFAPAGSETIALDFGALPPAVYLLRTLVDGRARFLRVVVG